MPHHIDDHKERPEHVVTRDKSEPLTDKVASNPFNREVGNKVIGSALQNKKKKKKQCRDPKHTRLTSATNRAADKGDAER